MGLYSKLLVGISNNALVQNLFEKQVRALHHAMGIGTSGDFNTDGEFAVFDLLEKHCQSPFCIFDVGANKGQFLSFIQAHMKDRQYTVHCFKPSLSTFRMLETNAKSTTQVKLNNLGLGRESNEATLYFGNAGSEGASLTKRDLAHIGVKFDYSETIRLSTLDDYCNTHDVEHIHLLKLDIEGHELDALQGATDMINSHKIDIILFEFGGCNIDTRKFFKDYWRFFENTGMDLFRATPTGYLFRITEYKECLEQFSYSNFIAVRKT